MRIGGPLLLALFAAGCTVETGGLRSPPMRDASTDATTADASLADTGPVTSDAGPDTDAGGRDGGCAPACAGRDCGDDGCGGSCGGCTAPDTCTPEGACEPPCGGHEMPCCALDTCEPGAECAGGTCYACGWWEQVCCETGDECLPAMTSCQSGRCRYRSGS